MKYVLAIAFNLLMISSCAQDKAADQVREVLQQQITAWNKGDIDTFMETYWKSDSLLFAGKNGITYGWQKTLENYKKSYPTKKDMGVLEFDLIKVQPLGTGYYNVVGKWHLKREMGDLKGQYTLIFRQIDGTWKIIQDHTS
ncbi:DUF4440 domain-containing protein [Niabella ginsenosidivorans]|uniref:DUF4440 domain-containing protein n=1 Tax=Niabella ginsenosidivorans TaxID=1176587 RepID=A0A1A9HW39_9BACT|nr:nuclear transport factor 2 family protein [Niabella ginsenosidivorans]ANH79597.1 DUF4440 domain-containing protein [Niabella ginsenosidivorans]